MDKIKISDCHKQKETITTNTFRKLWFLKYIPVRKSQKRK